MKLRRNRSAAGSDDSAAEIERDQTPPLDERWADDLGNDNLANDDFPGDVEPASALDLASPKRLWAWAIVITLVGLAIRGLWFYNFQDQLALRLGPDGDVYLGQARAFLAGGLGNPEAPGIANIDREVLAPGYGLFLAGLWSFLPRGDVLALTTHVQLIAFAAQSLLVALTTLITFAISRRYLFGFTSLIPPVLLTASIAVIEMTNMFAYETPLMFLLTTATWLLLIAHEHSDGEKSSRYLLASMLAALLLGAAIVAQPRVAIAIPFLIWWAVRGINWEHALMFALVVVVLPMAWIARDYAQFDRFVPISIAPQESLYIDNIAPDAGDGVADGAAPPGCPRSDLTSSTITDRFDWGDCMQQAGVEQISSNPDTAAMAVPGRLAALTTPWNPEYSSGKYSSARWGYQELIPQSVRDDPTYKTSFDILAIVFMILYAAAALVGVWILWAEGVGSGGRLLTIALVTLPLVHLLFHAEGRFRIPLLPLILIALTLGLLQFFELLRGNPDGVRGQTRNT